MIDDGRMLSLEAGPPRGGGTAAGAARTGPALRAEGRRRCDSLLLLRDGDDDLLLVVGVGAGRRLLLLLPPPRHLPNNLAIPDERKEGGEQLLRLADLADPTARTVVGAGYCRCRR